MHNLLFTQMIGLSRRISATTSRFGFSSTEAGGQGLDDSCPGEHPTVLRILAPTPGLRSLHLSQLLLVENPMGG